jgi:hypothetical protein
MIGINALQKLTSTAAQITYPPSAVSITQLMIFQVFSLQLGVFYRSNAALTIGSDSSG